MGVEQWWQVLLLASGAHVGLELVVHLVVYPALADASAGQTSSARAGHQQHMRRMSVAVAPVYGLLVLSTGAVVVSDPSPLAVAAAAVVVMTLAVTGGFAVPAHEAIVRCPEPAERVELHRRLARADLGRLVLAVALVPLAWVGAAG